MSDKKFDDIYVIVPELHYAMYKVQDAGDVETAMTDIYLCNDNAHFVSSEYSHQLNPTKHSWALHNENGKDVKYIRIFREGEFVWMTLEKYRKRIKNAIDNTLKAVGSLALPEID